MKKFTFLFLFAVAANLILFSSAAGQITQRGTSITASTTTTTLTINKPSGLQVGDVMIANIVQGDDDAPSISTHASSPGWNLVAGGQFGINGNNDWWGTVLYKVADAADVAATNFSFTLDAVVNGDGTVGGISAFYNVDVTGGVGPNGSGTGPFDVAVGSFYASGNSNGNPIQAPSITTVTANAAIIMAGMVGNNSGFGTWSATNPSSLSEILDFNTSDGPDQGVGLGWAIRATAGATGIGSVAAGNNRTGGVLFALKQGPPSLSLTPASTTLMYINSNVTANLSASVANWPGSGNYTFTWSVSPVGPTISGGNPVVQAGTSNSKTITFSATGSWTVTVSVSRTGATTMQQSVTVDVLSPNMYSTRGASAIQAWLINPVSGAVVAGPTDLFTPPSSTAALAKNAPNPNDPNGSLYWLPNSTGNNGVVDVYARNPNGTGVSTLVATIDINGASTSSLGFVRLGFDSQGWGWLLAGDGSTSLYLAKFQGNGTAATTIQIVNSAVTVNGGAVSDFQNGDLAFGPGDVMYALSNVTGGTTRIFSMAVGTQTTTLFSKWVLVAPGGANFTGSVNGVAFTQSGSIHLSTANGLFFIDQATASQVSGTVECAQITTETGLTDLASDKFPQQSTLPVKLISFTGAYRNQTTLLNWETENMYDMDRFEIQRSADGTNFATIGIKDALNAAARTGYQYSDNLSIIGGNVFYYRLKMVDADGSFKYSNVIMIRRDAGLISGIKISPNPVVTGNTTVRIEAAAKAVLDIRVLDMSGRVMLRQQNNVAEGVNSVALNNLEILQRGTYILQVNDGTGVQSARFTIIH